MSRRVTYQSPGLQLFELQEENSD